MPDNRARLYTILTAVFVTCLLVADLTGSKFFFVPLGHVGSWELLTHSVGQFAFPVTFLLTDLVNEFYGRRGARQLTWTALGCSGLAFLLVLAARLAPVSPQSPVPQEAFEAVFGMSNRLYVASLLAFLVGQMADIWLFGVLKRATRGRMVWLRATGSTVVSQAVDSVLVTWILLAGVPNQTGAPPSTTELVHIAGTGYALKFALALALTPLIYLGRWWMREKLGLQPALADEPPSAATVR